MTSSQEAYDYVATMIEQADTYFAFKCVDYCIEHYKSCFPLLIQLRKNLIDARHDKWTETFQKPNIQIKNQNNESGT